jgi:hypothetical protein
MFPNTGIESKYLDEFYIIDVILNRCPSRGGKGVNGDSAPPTDGMEVDDESAPPTDGMEGDNYSEPPTSEDGETEDCVVLVCSFKPEDEGDKNDFEFRVMILFLPHSGVLYFVRERRNECVGVPKILVPLDMSWLRLEKKVKRDGSVSYTFGEGGYVKRMHRQHASEFISENRLISA